MSLAYVWKRFVKEFQEFATHGKAVDIAIGTILGAGVTPVANSIVDDIVMPPVGLVLGKADLPNQYITIKEGEKGGPYKTLKDAQEDGAVTINYGRLINRSISLVVILGVAFAIVKLINMAKEAQEKAAEKEKQQAQYQSAAAKAAFIQQQESALKDKEVDPELLFKKARTLEQLQSSMRAAS